MTKINPYDLPESERNTHVVLRNIKWDVRSSQPGRLPINMRIPVEGSTPQALIVPKAIDIASTVWGYAILDCDVDPIRLPESYHNEDSLSDTLDYEGEIY